MKFDQWINKSVSADERLKRAQLNLRVILKKFNKHKTMLALWEVQRLQNRGDSSPARIRGLPIGGLGQSGSDGKPFIFPWMIEQTINIVSIYGHDYNSNERTLDPFEWNNLANLHNSIREYNDARSGVFLKESSVFETMSRIGRQQFHWQDGSLGESVMELYASIYLGDVCDQACRDIHKIGASDFLSYGFIIFAHFNSSPYLEMPYNLSNLDGDQEILRAVLQRYSLPLTKFYQGCRVLRKGDPFGEYSKSQLRMKPIIRVGGGKYFCPAPSMLQFRFTSGLISETSYNGDAVNEVAKNYENYCFEKISKAYPDVRMAQEEEYGTKKKSKRTPDIRVYIGGALKIIIECKATLLPYEDKFENVKLDQLPQKAKQITKGILQVWRYIRNVREGIAPDSEVADSCKGIVLTLEEWITIDMGRHDLLLDEAHKIADAENIPRVYRIETVVTSIKDLNYVLERSMFDEFIGCLDIAKSPDFNGYLLQNVFRETYGNRSAVRELMSDQALKKNIWYWGESKQVADERRAL